MTVRSCEVLFGRLSGACKLLFSSKSKLASMRKITCCGRDVLNVLGFTSHMAWSGSRPTRRWCSWCATMANACVVIAISGRVITTPDQPGTTKTLDTSQAMTPSATTSYNSSTISPGSAEIATTSRCWSLRRVCDRNSSTSSNEKWSLVRRVQFR